MKKVLIYLLLSAFTPFLKAQQVQSIQEAMANYDYENALTLIAHEDSLTVPLLYQKGRALKGLGRNAEALDVFRLLTVQDSLNPRAYIEAGECYKTLGKFQPPLQCYRRP